jgi:glycine/D-amino acid oxidase-like deaminating enzyme
MVMMKNYASYSYWLESVPDDLTPRPALAGTVDADVGILGAGFSGLWTAYYLLKRDPSLRVVIVEREIAGFGASGRNGGWCTSGFPLSLNALERRFGRDAAVATAEAMISTVDEVGRVTHEEGLDIDWAKGGALRIARGPHQLPAITGAMKTYEKFALERHYQLLSEEDTAERITVTNAKGAIYTPNAATIHPGKLVRGLARVVERLGGTIYEQSPVINYVTGAYPVLQTATGNVRARTIVLAGEAYLAQLPPLKRQLIPIYSLIVLTEPLPDEIWRQIGWESRFTVASNKLTVDYLSKTTDGRILFGGRGAPYRFNSAMKDEYDRHGQTHQMLREAALDWFPMLKETRFTHAWGGPLGVPRDYMPTMSFDPAQGVATARGYTGQGVATTNLSGRVLTDRINGQRTEITELPMVGHRSRNWEPEPLRWLGARYVQNRFAKIDHNAEQTGIPPTGRSVAERLNAH